VCSKVEKSHAVWQACQKEIPCNHAGSFPYPVRKWTESQTKLSAEHRGETSNSQAKPDLSDICNKLADALAELARAERPFALPRAIARPRIREDALFDHPILRRIR